MRTGVQTGPSPDCGWVCSSAKREWLNEFDKLRLPYNINALTQAAATFALSHYDVPYADARAGQCARAVARLFGIAGVTMYPSQANFILIRVLMPRPSSKTPCG